MRFPLTGRGSRYLETKMRDRDGYRPMESQVKSRSRPLNSGESRILELVRWGYRKSLEGKYELGGDYYQFERQRDYSFASDISLEAQSKLLR